MNVLPLALALAVGGACKKKTSAALKKPDTSQREAISNLPFADTDRSRPPQAKNTDEVGNAPQVEKPDDPGAKLTAPLEGEVENVDDAKLALAKLWSDLELSCWSMEGCFQRGDLDGDGKLDSLVMVKQVCDAAPCPVGVVVISSRGKHLRLGAGMDPLLPWLEWELDKKKQVVWSLASDARSGENWVGTQSVLVSPTGGESKCATAMGVDNDALIITGPDASGALLWQNEGWAMTDCGY